ncbi:hypothetical protein OIE66_36575 [Nonomuraea sp. NBC_01738]|uniref:hypothetical protein n=1 Tax=Nonomuraea sp. NBC_01738 TaxID=2976003 RepID=UPI002E113F68|nr:hypothetical protein OIE66_36575 [Nonomuraea sp. NBC_01738]
MAAPATAVLRLRYAEVLDMVTPRGGGAPDRRRAAGEGDAARVIIRHVMRLEALAFPS